MSGVAPTPYHQDIQNDIGALNPASTPLLAHPADISTGFLPPVSAALPPTTLQPQMLQEPPATFVAMADVPASTSTAANTMVVAMPDVSPPVYMTPMENIVPRSHARAPPPGFLTDLSACNQFPMVSAVENSMRLDVSPSNHSLTISPSQSQVSSPSAHGSSSSYSSRTNTSVSPVAVPSSFIPVPSPNQPAIVPAFSTSEAAVTKSEEILAEPEPHIILGDMLEDIVKTASSARDACKMRHGAEASSKLDELKERISQVSQMFAGLMAGLSLSDRTFTAPYATPMQSPPALTEPQTINFPPVPVGTANIAASPMELTDVSGLSDQSRKRCASEFVEHRTIKAPKREAQDDDTLSLPVAEPPSAVDPTFAMPSIPSLSIAASMPMPVPPSSQPSSRPPTPNSFNARTPFSPTKPSSGLSMFPPFLPGGSASMDFAPSIPTPLTSAPAQVFSPVQGWTEPVIQQRHHHSLSTGSLTSILPAVAPVSPGIPENFTAPPIGQVPVPSASPATIATSVTSPIGRMSRSGSISGAFPTSYNFTYKESLPDAAGSWSGRVQPQTPSSQTTSPWFGGNDKAASSGSPIPTEKTTANTTLASSRKLPLGQEDEDDDDGDSDENDGNTTKVTQPSSSDAPLNSGSGTNSSPSSDVPAEYRAEVDRIFFEYLNKICSNLDATDSKGEPIHQTLMAKKMQRLDESPDFRPFKFRIQAFTLAFLEELARQGYPEEKIPMKKIRNYLWRQQYILRFNEDGKKAKSKGNHIWNIEAKKAGDGKWEFRPFHRKLAGSPPSVAYCGLKWSWTPRVWDPQASWQNVPVEYSSPNLPSWLSWKDDILSGIPPPDAESCTITVNAKYILDGQEGHLFHTFHLTIAPMNSVDTTTFSRSRRPSLAGDPPKRSTSDSALFQAAQRTKPRTSPSVGDPESPNHRVIRVLQNVAQRVTEEAESQLVLASPPRTNFQDLVKQKHVIEQTVEAYDKAISGQTPPQGRRLAVAAQNVVVQAAHSVIADRTVAGGGIPVPQSETTAIKSVTVSELTDATQDAIAEAVKREGTESSEVDIIVAATSILKSRTPGSPSTADPPPVLGLQARSHSTGTVPRLMTASNYPPPALPPLTEYV